ncbi:MAG: thiamine diphosphokinase [Parvibaculaceae bacterium]
MASFTILAGGHLTPTERLRRQIAGRRVIAADSGMAHAGPLGLEVELWVGDFDSSSPELLARHADVERVTFPAAKAKTDTELAVEEALARGATDLVMVGGFGGQADHALSHLLLAVSLKQKGYGMLVTSGTEEAWPLLAGEMALDLPPGSRMSILPFSALKAISLGNVVWPLERRDVPLGSTLTLSNVALGTVDIRLEDGYAAVIVYPAEI